MSEVTDLLADALVYAAELSHCVAILVKVQKTNSEPPWCKDCVDAEGCWAWHAVGIVSTQELEEAQKRRRHSKYMRYSHRPSFPIEVSKHNKHDAASEIKSSVL
jgi:hypothetical protein